MSWCILSASTIGASHAHKGVACQDAHQVQKINPDWSVNVICDGAGIYPHSGEVASYIAPLASDLFRSHAIRKGWHKRDSLPRIETWRRHSIAILGELKDALDRMATELDLPLESLACTIIVVIASPCGVLTTHIGDGRAAIRTHRGQWKTAMTPHKGGQFNETIFLCSDWESDPEAYVETRTISEPITGFALMSDGMANHAFISSALTANGKFVDPNLPDQGFLEPNFQALYSQKEQGTSIELVNQSWIEYIQAGNEALKEEYDDKTIIMGARCRIR